MLETRAAPSKASCPGAPDSAGKLSAHTANILSEVIDLDYEEIRKRLEEAYRLSPDAESYLRQVLIIWAEFGLIQGEWSCNLAEAG